MFCLRILLLLHSSLQARGRTSLLMIISVLSTLVTTSLAAAPNKCIVSGTYLDITSAATTVLLLPENGSLTEVGEKRCAFKVFGNTKECFRRKYIEYTAVDVDDKDAQFCSFFEEHAVCVCPFFGCNSATGVLYETLMKSLWATGKVKGEDYTPAVDAPVRDRPIECLLKAIERLAGQGNAGRDISKILMLKPSSTLNNLRRDAPWLFPKQQRVEELIQMGREITTTVATTSTITAEDIETTSTVSTDVGASGVVAVAAGAAPKNGKKTANNGLKKVSLVLNVFLSLTAIAMITFIVGVLVYRKKKKNQKTADKNPTQLSKLGLADPGGASTNRSVSSSAAAGPSFQGPPVSSNK